MADGLASSKLVYFVFGDLCFKYKVVGVVSNLIFGNMIVPVLVLYTVRLTVKSQSIFYFTNG